MTPMKAARDVTAKLRDVKTVALDGTGHALMAEKPDEVLDALVGFLKREANHQGHQGRQEKPTAR